MFVSGNPDHVFPGHEKGSFMEPVLLRTDTPWTADAVHDVEAFGPVSTIMPYKDLDDAIALANRGMGSLALSLFTHDGATARDFVQRAGAFHVRMLVIDRTNAAESTGLGSPLPRSAEHTSEPQSLMRISFAVFCFNKNNNTKITCIL